MIEGASARSAWRTAADIGAEGVPSRLSGHAELVERHAADLQSMLDDAGSAAQQLPRPKGQARERAGDR